MKSSHNRVWTLGPLVVVLALAGCSGKQSGSSGDSTTGVKTDVGVTSKTITMGVMTDLSGPSKNNGAALVEGNKLWADEVNEAGGICGRSVAFETADHGYKVDAAATIYRQQEPKVLGYMQLLGAPIISALRSTFEADDVTVQPVSYSSFNLDSKYLITPGTTFDVEMVNGLSYLQEKGLLRDGDTVGHIFLGGEYGENGLQGARWYAKKHNLKLVEAKTAPTDTDMANNVTRFRGAGVKAILLTTTGGQAASVLNSTASLGLNVPIIGNAPSYDPNVPLGNAAATAAKQFYIASSTVPFGSDAAAHVRARFEKKGGANALKSYAVMGYVDGLIWQQILERACQNGDLTRAGVHKAFTESKTIKTNGLTASDLDYSRPGSPPSRASFILRPDPSANGGLRIEAQSSTSADAKEYPMP